MGRDQVRLVRDVTTRPFRSVVEASPTSGGQLSVGTRGAVLGKSRRRGVRGRWTSDPARRARLAEPRQFSGAVVWSVFEQCSWRIGGSTRRRRAQDYPGLLLGPNGLRSARREAVSGKREQEKLQFLLQWQQEAAKVRCPADNTSTSPPPVAPARGPTRACGVEHLRAAAITCASDIRAGAMSAL